MSRSRGRQSCTIADFNHRFPAGLNTKSDRSLSDKSAYGVITGNNPINAIDPLGLEASLLVFRHGPNTPSVVSVFQDGTHLGTFNANTNGFLNNPHEAAAGTYPLTPRKSYTNGDKFINGTPFITGLNFVHPEGKSKGCLTVEADWANRIWDIMNDNLNRGGTTITYIDLPKGIERAIPVVQPALLSRPGNHSWPGFNHQGDEPIPAWP